MKLHLHEAGTTKIIPIVIVLLVAAVIGGWWLGRSDKNTVGNGSSVQSQGSSASSDSEVKALVSYAMPNGWKENSCTGASDVFVNPPKDNLDCGAERQAAVVISVDANGTNDCSQLQSVQNVSGHVCISEYINDMRSLKSETIYNESSVYGKNTTFNTYYIDTGKGIVKVDYQHDPSNGTYKAAFEQLAKSVKAKN